MQIRITFLIGLKMQNLISKSKKVNLKNYTFLEIYNLLIYKLLNI